MRSLAIVAMLALGSFVLPPAKAQILPREHTRVSVPLSSDAPDESESEFHAVGFREHVAEFRLVPRAAVRLTEDVSVYGATYGDAPIRIEAGASLIAAFSADGSRYFCAVRRRPGLIPLQMWACLRDGDDDGEFDVAGQANPAMGLVLPLPYAVFTMSQVSATYEPLADADRPAYDVAIAFSHIRRGTIGLTFRAREAGAEEWRDLASSANYLTPFAGAEAASLPRTIILGGAEIEIQSFDPQERVIVARIVRGMPDNFEIGVSQTNIR